MQGGSYRFPDIEQNLRSSGYKSPVFNR